MSDQRVNVFLRISVEDHARYLALQRRTGDGQQWPEHRHIYERGLEAIENEDAAGKAAA